MPVVIDDEDKLWSAQSRVSASDGNKVANGVSVAGIGVTLLAGAAAMVLPVLAPAALLTGMGGVMLAGVITGSKVISDIAGLTPYGQPYRPLNAGRMLAGIAVGSVLVLGLTAMALGAGLPVTATAVAGFAATSGIVVKSALMLGAIGGAAASFFRGIKLVKDGINPPVQKKPQAAAIPSLGPTGPGTVWKRLPRGFFARRQKPVEAPKYSPGMKLRNP